MRHLTPSGSELAWESYGRDDARRLGDLVFFNGLFVGASSFAFQYRNRELLKRFRMIFFDYRCQGKSMQVETPFLIGDVFDDIRSFLDSLELKEPTFIGHSFGGLLCRLLLGDDPWRLKGLVLLNTADQIPPQTREFFSRFMSDWAAALEPVSAEDPAAIAAITAEIFARLVPRLFGARYRRLIEGYESDVIARYVDYNSRPKAVMQLWRALSSRAPDDDELGAVAATLRCPKLVIVGRQEVTFPVPCSEIMTGRMTSARLRIFEESAHCCHIEQRDEFNVELLEFLKSVYESPSPGDAS